MRWVSVTLGMYIVQYVPYCDNYTCRRSFQTDWGYFCPGKKYVANVFLVLFILPEGTDETFGNSFQIPNIGFTVSMRSNSPCWKVFNYTRDRICKPFKEPRNRLPAWRAGATTLFGLFGVPSRQIPNV